MRKFTVDDVFKESTGMVAGNKSHLLAEQKALEYFNQKVIFLTL